MLTFAAVPAFERAHELSPDDFAPLLLATAASGRPAPKAATLSVGALEDSNASPIQCMGELVQATRHFEAYEKAIEAFRAIDEKAASRLGSAG